MEKVSCEKKQRDKYTCIKCLGRVAERIEEEEEKVVIKCKIHNNNNNTGLKYAEGSRNKRNGMCEGRKGKEYPIILERASEWCRTGRGLKGSKANYSPLSASGPPERIISD